MANNQDIKHFDDTWTDCENFHKNGKSQQPSKAIIDELSMKLKLYNIINEQSNNLPAEELKQIKSRAMGEILLAMTHLSLVDDVNVHEALSLALQYRTIEELNVKHPL